MATTKKPASKGSTQIVLFSAKEPSDEFRKAVEIVHSTPAAPLSPLQRKIGNALIKHALESQEDERGFFTIGLMDLERTIGYDSNNRQYLKDAAEALMRIVFDWDVLAKSRAQWKKSVLIPEVELHSDHMKYQISGQMRESVLNPKVYALIDMEVMKRLRRSSSMAIWEMCVRFERVGYTTETHWMKLRDMVMGESSDKQTYQQYKFFKSKALLPAIKEINTETNHTIELVEKHIGRSVSTIQFKVSRKNPVRDIEVKDARLIETIGEMARIGVPQSEARRLAKEYDFDEIRTALDYLKKRDADKKLSAIENKAAYFRQALQGRYGSTAKTKPIAAAPAQDLRAAFQGKRQQDARGYFLELDTGEQEELTARYNEIQVVPALKLSKRTSKAAESAFFTWLSQDVWGEPSSEDLLTFAQEMIGSLQQ